MADRQGIIIGGGCAGLTAGAYLAKAGHDVVVYEQHTSPGGYWASFLRGGHIFDIGPHWTIKPERINHALEELGVGPVSFERMDTIGHYVLMNDGFDLVLNRDRKAMEGCIYRRFPTVKEGTVERMIDQSLALALELDNAPTKSPELMSLPEKLAFALKAPWNFKLTLKYSKMRATEYLEELFPGPELEGLRTALLMVAPAEGMPALGVMVFLAFALRGDAHRPVGGTKVVAEALAKAVEKNGGKIEYGKKVNRIITEGKKARGVVLEDGTESKSAYVISGVDAHQMYDHMLDGSPIPTKFAAKLKDFPISQTYFIVSLVTDLDPSSVGLGQADWFVASTSSPSSVGVSDDPEGGFFHIGAAHYHDERSKEGTYGMQILSQATFDHELAWGTEPGLVRGARYKELKKEYALRLLPQVDRMVPGLQGHIVSMDLATPITMHRYTLNHKGAANGWSYSRVENWKKEIPFLEGLYHVGHWTGPSGIHGCIGSGSTAAQLIIRRYGK